MSAITNIQSIDEGEFQGKRVLLRIDINSPVNSSNGEIVNDNRIVKSAPTIRDLAEKGAKLVLIAHQGDTSDYASLISLRQHADLLAEAVGKPIDFIEDIAGPGAIERILDLSDGEILLLDNLRYLCEEVSTFEDSVKLDARDMTSTFLVRKLAPLFDCYVNDAFSAAHRNAPSMVAFQTLMPSYAGRLLIDELGSLEAITSNPAKPCIYLLGGSRAGDAFGMIDEVLKSSAADQLLLSGLVGQIFLMADGVSLGESSESFILNKGYEPFIGQAAVYLSGFREKIAMPVDVAVIINGKRQNIDLDVLSDEMSICDIGDQTIQMYERIIKKASTLFVNGPPGIYEQALSDKGTRALWSAIAEADGFTVAGGGDSVTSFGQFTDINKLNYVSTAGGALIRYLSGVPLPLLEAFGCSTEANN